MRVDINYDGAYENMEPETVTIIGDKPRLFEPEWEIAESGELLLRRKERLVQFYADPGGHRTVALRNLTFR